MRIKKYIFSTISVLILSCQNLPNNITQSIVPKSPNFSENKKELKRFGVLSWQEVNDCYNNFIHNPKVNETQNCELRYDRVYGDYEPWGDEAINVECTCTPKEGSNGGEGSNSGGASGDEPDCGSDNTFSAMALNTEQKDNLRYLRDLFKIFTEVDEINKYQYEITKTYNQAYYTEIITNTQNNSLFAYLSNKLRHNGEVNIEYISKLDNLINSLDKISSTNVFSENIDIKNNIANRISDLKAKFSNTPKIYQQFNSNLV